MVVLAGPDRLMMGSPTTEAGRQEIEIRHKRRSQSNLCDRRQTGDVGAISADGQRVYSSR